MAERKSEFVIKIRNTNNNRPMGYAYFRKDIINGEIVISIGWSKVNMNYDKFDKAIGRNIASKRADKCYKWISNINDINSFMGSHEFVYSTNIPYIIKYNMDWLLPKVKRVFKLEEPVVFVISYTYNEITIGDGEYIHEGTSRKNTHFIKFKF